MLPLHDDASTVSAEDGSARRREKSESESESASRLPTAEECAVRLSSILNATAAPPSPPREAGSSRRTTRRTTPDASSRDARRPARPATKEIRIGSGSDVFAIHIAVERFRENAEAPSGEAAPKRNVWLSYRSFGTLVQSDIFALSHRATPRASASAFAPLANDFRVRASWPELVEYFHQRKNATLRVHLCAEGEVLGTASVDLRPLVADEGGARDTSAFESKVLQREYVVESRSRTSNEGAARESYPQISVKMSIHRNPACHVGDDASQKPVKRCEQPPGEPHPSISAQTVNPTCADKASSPIRQNDTTDEDPECLDDGRPWKVLQKKEEELNSREAELSRREKAAYEAVAALETKRGEWEKWRHRQELEWHEKLRGKEAAMMRALEDRACALEKEGRSSLEASKKEYETLQVQLRKAMMEVEAKERRLKDAELGHQGERKRKLAEIELRERLMKEELKYSIEIEVSVHELKPLAQIKPLLTRPRSKRRSTRQ